MTVRKMEEVASYEHQSLGANDLISTDIARRTRLSRLYVALCTTTCVGVLVLLLARIFLFK